MGASTSDLAVHTAVPVLCRYSQCVQIDVRVQRVHVPLGRAASLIQMDLPISAALFPCTHLPSQNQPRTPARALSHSLRSPQLLLLLPLLILLRLMMRRCGDCVGLSVFSKGMTWTEFRAIEPYSNTTTNQVSAYGSITARPDGSRIFALWIQNTGNVQNLPGGTPSSSFRADMLGQFVWRT